MPTFEKVFSLSHKSDLSIGFPYGTATKRFFNLSAAVEFRFVSIVNKLNATVICFAEHLSNDR